MAVVISGTAGTWSHGNSVTISGSGFGTKATAAPMMWDNCATGTYPTDKGWSGYWPQPAPDSTTPLAYRAAQRGIALPHSNISRYLAGAHYPDDDDYLVMFWKDFTFSAFPTITYASWYQRFDDAWDFGGDNNTKCYSFDHNNNGVYIEYNPRPESTTNTPGWNMPYSPASPPETIVMHAFGDAINPMSGVWSKVEIETKYANDASGYVKLWENGSLKSVFTGVTNTRSLGEGRNIGIGGYARSRPSINNWRYFADVYLDLSGCRVVLANNSNISLATIKEVQIPTAWSSTSITVTVNLGKFSSGTVYLFVFDNTATPNGTGYSVNLSGTVVAPVAAFSASATSGQAPLSVTFTDQSTNTPTSWAWDFDTSANNYSTPDTASTQGPHAVTYDYGGAFNARLTVSNSAGSDIEDKSLSVRYLKPTNFGAT